MTPIFMSHLFLPSNAKLIFFSDVNQGQKKKRNKKCQKCLQLKLFFDPFLLFPWNVS